MLNLIRPRNFEKEFFDDFFSPSFTNTTMKTDVTEKENEYLFEVELPGFNREDVKLSLNDGYLTIEAAKTIENNTEGQGKKYVRKERYYGTQSRSYYIGNVEESQIKASFNNGVLEIEVPKQEKEIEDKTKYIEID